MKLINNTQSLLTHREYRLAPKGIKDIPDSIAKIWLNIPGVEKYIGQDDLKKAQKEAQAKAKAEKDALEKELQKTKDELAKLKEAQAKAKDNKD